jgi:hypothetical protein
MFIQSEAQYLIFLDIRCTRLSLTHKSSSPVSLAHTQILSYTHSRSSPKTRSILPPPHTLIVTHSPAYAQKYELSLTSTHIHTRCLSFSPPI